MTNDLTHPSDLFSEDTTVTDIKKISNDGKSNAMLVTKVNYGRQYLMTADKSGSGWNGCWAKFNYDNTLDINGNGLYLNNKAVDNT